MADPVNPPPPEHASPSEQAPLVAAPTPRRAREDATQRRFHLAYFVLAVVVGVAVGALIVVLGRPSEGSAPDWSAWRPAAEGEAATGEIARFVGSRYHLPSGNQIVSVIPKPPVISSGTNGDVPVSAIAIRNVFRGQQIKVYRTDKAIFYYLCGSGTRCAIGEGKPSVERGRLIRREALELALYTLRYVKGVDSVVAFVPPKKGQQAQSLLFFQRSDLGPVLERPLDQTLPERRELRPATLGAADLAAVGALADTRAFDFEYQQIQDGTLALFLQPLTA